MNHVEIIYGRRRKNYMAHYLLTIFVFNDAQSHIPSKLFSSFQSLSRVWLFATPWITAHQASLSITNSRNLSKLMSIESVMPSNHLILCCHLPLLPSIFPSIRVFSNESALRIRWPKYWSFSFNIRSSNERPGLISFRMDWLDIKLYILIKWAIKCILQCLGKSISSLARLILWPCNALFGEGHVDIYGQIMLCLWVAVFCLWL